jgi:hypothetical protein
MGRFSRFAEETIKFCLIGSEEYGFPEIELKRLPTKYLAKIAKMQDKVINEENMTAILEIVVGALKISYPDENEAELDVLATRYFSEIFEKIIELNFGEEANKELKKNLE